MSVSTLLYIKISFNKGAKTPISQESLKDNVFFVLKYKWNTKVKINVGGLFQNINILHSTVASLNNFPQSATLKAH